MGTSHFKTMFRLAAAILSAGVIFGTLPGSASDLSASERKQERADKIRERAKAGARVDLGYEDVFPSLRRDDYDPYLLSQQIARLAAMIRQLADVAASRPPGGLPLTAPPGLRPTVEGDEIATTYGPKGPTVESVKLLLDYYLMVAGNPRLAAGRVRDAGDAVHAQVVTKDGGAVVEEYAVNKKSGVWVPVR
jgi:hypothetical protein